MKEKLRDSLKLFKLSERKMRVVKGGGPCCCGCLYQDSGGSSMIDNAYANDAEGKRSPGFCEKVDG